VTIIGDYEKSEEVERRSRPELPRDEALEIPDSRITVLQNCTSSGSQWFDGFANKRETEGERWEFWISYATVIIMVQTFALPILHLATCGRVTPQCFWRIAMHCGWSEGVNSPGLEEVDYGEISSARDDIPKTVPWLKYGELRDLEELGGVKAVEDAIVHRGGYWM